MPFKYLIEKLTLANWTREIWPVIKKGPKGVVYVLDVKPSVFRLAQKMARSNGWELKILSFRLLDVRDEKNLLLFLRIAYKDANEVVRDIVQRYLKPHLAKGTNVPDGFKSYLQGNLATSSLYGFSTLEHVLLLIQLAVWSGAVTLFLRQRPWWEALSRYASKFGVCLVELSGEQRPAFRPAWLRAIYHRLKNRAWHLKYRKSLRVPQFRPAGKGVDSPKIAVECHYHVNLNHPEIFSELFFLQESGLKGEDLLVTFHVPKDPLDLQKFSELKQYGIRPLPLRADATTVAECPPYQPSLRLRRRASWRFAQNGFLGPIEARWFKEQEASYSELFQFWSEFFARHHSRIFLSWFKFGPQHCAIGDALRRQGGLCALYQRALETNPSASCTVDSDLFFGFSKFSAGLEKEAGSRIRSFVVTGYLGDHRFPLLKEVASFLRAGLRARGAGRIVAYMDENSHDDERWSLGHGVTREGYSFLLSKVLEDPTMGLVLKPKIPSTLRRRLGDFSGLLEQALATGRCHIFEEGAVHGSYPPAIAALASDVAIHGHLMGATAGFEAALTGTPTLLMDQEGWGASPLYQLGVGKVVFNDWPSLWEACNEHWKTEGRIPGFGDWSLLLDVFDPFRDGKAANRMGTFLEWMVAGFKEGKDAGAVQADACERYAGLWGHDKIIPIA